MYWSAAELGLSYSKSRENYCNNSEIASLHRALSLFFFLKVCVCVAETKCYSGSVICMFCLGELSPALCGDGVFSTSPYHCSISRRPEVNCRGFMDINVFSLTVDAGLFPPALKYHPHALRQGAESYSQLYRHI